MPSASLGPKPAVQPTAGPTARITPQSAIIAPQEGAIADSKPVKVGTVPQGGSALEPKPLLGSEGGGSGRVNGSASVLNAATVVAANGTEMSTHVPAFPAPPPLPFKSSAPAAAATLFASSAAVNADDDASFFSDLPEGNCDLLPRQPDDLDGGCLGCFLSKLHA